VEPSGGLRVRTTSASHPGRLMCISARIGHALAILAHGAVIWESELSGLAFEVGVTGQLPVAVRGCIGRDGWSRLAGLGALEVGAVQPVVS